MKVVPVILAGGIGERFWPMSKSTMPKQLLAIISNKSMLEETINRVKPFCKNGVLPLIMTSTSIAGKIKNSLKNKIKYDIIAEPVGKNTAPPVAAAASFIKKKYGDAIMLVLSADHAISPAKEFISSVKYAVNQINNDNSLFVFGIPPVRPDTGYGYIQIGKKLESNGDITGFKVKRFVEKPTASKAKIYLKSGKYYWNSGMFVWKASFILEEMKKHMPSLYKNTVKLEKDGFNKKSIANFFETSEKQSIDYGILEKSTTVNVVCGNFNWDDIGSWDAMDRVHETDSNNTALVGKSIYSANNSNSIIVNNSSKTVATIGLDNMVVVTTDDAILVIPRAELPNIKEHIAEMKKNKKFSKKLF